MNQTSLYGGVEQHLEVILSGSGAQPPPLALCDQYTVISNHVSRKACLQMLFQAGIRIYKT